MSKPKFKVGDKVRILDGSKIKNYIGGWADGMERFTGEIVTIQSVFQRSSMPNSYHIKEHLYTWDERGLELVKPEKIIIYRNGAEVVAKNTATGKTGVARCNPADEFDFNTGAKLAFERLINPEPVKPKYYSGKVVCIKSLESFSIVGKIYNVKDGILDFENGLTSTTRFKSIDDINIHCKSKYIELVE